MILEAQTCMSDVALIDPCRDARWDEFVSRHPLGQIYHLSGWKKALESCFRHIRGRFLVIADGRGETIQAGLPIYDVRSWLIGNRLIAAPFATLFDPLVTGPDDLNLLLDRIRGMAREERAKYVEIRTMETGRWFAQGVFGESRYFLHHQVTLDRPLEAIWKTFHRSCVRQRISRAETSGLHIRTGRDKSDLRAFYELLAQTRRRKSLPAQPFRFMEALWDVFLPENRLLLLLAEKDSLIVAGLLLLVFKDRVIAEFLASGEAFNKISPVHGLFWQAIQWAHGRGYRVFDFGRTSPANTSLLEFKSHWGTSVRELPHFYYPPEEAGKMTGFDKSWKYTLFRTLSSEKIPSPVSKWVGNLIYRHLG